MGRRGCDRMVVRLTNIYAISPYYNQRCEFESHQWRGALETTLFGKVCQWLAAGR